MARSKTFRILPVLASLAAATAEPATLPSGFAETQIVSGLPSPTAMAFAPDGRLFVCEQGGRLRVVKNGALLAAPFLTVTVSSVGERGLLGVAFDPSFASNGFVYVYYTATTPTIHNRVSRFTASGDVAAAGSEVVVMDLETLSGATNHNGGALHFGPDGMLYVAVGDNATGSNSQTLANRLGKMLRIQPDGGIPADNPFFATATGDNRAIWALGLRNPFTFAFHRTSGRMFVNDVGQSAWEEINDGIAGSNYGWPATEGETANPAYRSPLLAYGHGSSGTTGCAIAGGAFYDAQALTFPASLHDDYFFADYCTGWIRSYDPATDTAAAFATGLSSPVDLQVHPDGSLYYLQRGFGAVYRIQYTAGLAPTIGTHPADATVPVGQPATFSVSASGTPPLSYQWQRNGSDIAGATGTSYTLASAQLADDGALFRCVVSNAFGAAASNAARLTVTPDLAPSATIDLPAPGALYTAGDTLTWAGTAGDPEDGPLGGSAFTWQIDFHHDTHSHPFLPPTSGATGGSIAIPTTGETSANVFYRVILTVRDSAANTTTVTRDVLPRTATVSVESVPPGLEVLLDGQPGPTPRAFPGVAGVVRQIEAPSPQLLGGKTWLFDSWSDGGPRAHAITTPLADATLVATFVEAPSEQAVRVLTVSSASERNVLELVNPLSAEYVSTVVVVRSDRFPADPADGTVLYSSGAAGPGGRVKVVHGPLTNDQAYYYGAFVNRSAPPLVSPGRFASGRPFSANGPVKWAFTTGATALAAPTVGGAGVLATSNDRSVYLIERGALAPGGEWPAGYQPSALGGPVQARSPIVPIDVLGANPVVFMGAQNGSVYAIDAARGNVLWERPVGPMVQAAPAGIFSAFGGTLDYVLVGTRDSTGPNAFVALDPATGSELGRFDNGAAGAIGVVNHMAAVQYGPPSRVYFSSYAGSPGSATTLWCFELRRSPDPVFTLVWQRALGNVDSGPVLRGGRVYVGSLQGGGTVFSLDAATGGDERVFVHGNGQVKVLVFPDRASNDLYFATDDFVWGVTDSGGAAMTNKFAGGISLGAGVRPSAVLFVPGSHYVYVGGSDGKLHEIDVLPAVPVLKAVTLGDGLAAVGAPSLDRIHGLVHVGSAAGVFYAVQVPLP